MMLGIDIPIDCYVKLQEHFLTMNECEKIMVTFSMNGFLRPIDLETLFLIVLDILHRPNEH